MTRDPTDNCALDTAICLSCANAGKCDNRDRRRFSYGPHEVSSNLCRDQQNRFKGVP
jgi:hypothetical protein